MLPGGIAFLGPMPEIPSPQRRPRRRLRRALIATATTVTLAAGGGTAWALDRFVIDHVEISDVAAYEAAQGVSDSTVSAAGGTVTRDTYTFDGASDHVHRHLRQRRGHGHLLRTLRSCPGFPGTTPDLLCRRRSPAHWR